MKITIHRGTHQIGGCVTEIESEGYKVFIDLGEQLPGAVKAELPPIDGLSCGNASKSALFFTHYHGDHIGRICDTVDDLQIYMGKTALDIFQCLENRLSHIPDTFEITHANTSGHADVQTLKAVFEILNPKGGIIPIHTDAPERFKELFHDQNKIIPLIDGQVFHCL